MSLLHTTRLSTHLLRLVGSNIHNIADEPGVKLFFDTVYWYYGVHKGRRLWDVEGRKLTSGVSGGDGDGNGGMMGRGRRRRVPFVVRRRL